LREIALNQADLGRGCVGVGARVSAGSFVSFASVSRMARR
jgi:hypothetical protein